MAERKARRLDAEALYEYALRALAGRAHSIGELRQKLLRRAQSEEDIPGVIARLKEFGYLDDQRFAESFATARLEDQGLGRMRVLRDLRQRRVAPAVAGKAVERAYSGADELALIEQFLRRKYRKIDLAGYLADPRQLAAAYRRLRGAGFSSGNTLRVLKRFAAEPELLDGIEEAGESEE